MDFNIEVRKKQLQSLDQYITTSKDRVQSILDYLGWHSKNVLEKEAKVTCSINYNHRIPTKNSEEHMKNCYYKTLGYGTNEKLLSEPLHDSTTSIKLDNAKKLEILSQARYNNHKFKAAWNGQDCEPMTSDRLFSTFSTDERLTLYDYCVKNTECPPVPSEFNVHIDDKKDKKLLTEEDLLVKERDAKRRRAKYKSVHTSRNKNHTEVMKEVIENQMELYKEYLTKNIEDNTYSLEQNDDQNIRQYSSIENTHQNEQTEYKEKLEETVERPPSSVSRHSAHSSSSRSKRDYEYYRLNDDRKRNEDYNYKNDYKREHSPYKDKRRKYTNDYKDSRNYSRDRHHRNYKSDHRY